MSTTQWPRTVDLREHIHPGDVVVWSHAGGEPPGLVARLLEQRHEFGGNISVFLSGVSFSETLQPEHADVIRFVSIGGIGTHSRLARARCLDVIPCRFSDIPDLIATRRIPVDVAMFSGSLPDVDGRISLGPTMAIARELMDAARVSLVEINPHVPFVFGDTLVDIDQFDVVVESDATLVAAPAGRSSISPTTRRLCENVATLVPDRATLQVGFGSVGRALPAFLADRTDLGVHSAIMTDELVELIDSGVITGAAKERDAGLVVCGELLGSPRLYRFADRNPNLALRSSSYLLSQQVLGEFSSLVSINSALQVDLTGQVNAESRDGVHVGAVGGAVDFVRAAARSQQGASIIALPSSTSDGRSRIVSALDRGVVTTARSEVEFVVTEYGVADLRGRPLSDRARALVSVAHPEHRDALAAIDVAS